MQGSKVLLAAALTVALSGAAIAQDRDHGRSQDGDHGRPAAQMQTRRPESDHEVRRAPATSQWQQGRQDGDRDGDRARTTAQWQQGRQDRDRDWNRDRDGDRDDRYRRGQAYPGTYYPGGSYPSGVYSAYGRQGVSQAEQIGYQDGLNDGSNDRATGHSFRPTEDSNYRHANRGWNSGIDRDSYSATYRQAYMQGYQRGYGGQGSYGRWPY